VTVVGLWGGEPGVCKFCGGDVSRDSPGWWNKDHCTRGTCLIAKAEERRKAKDAKHKKKSRRRTGVKKIVFPYNGRNCRDCGGKLRGNLRMYCKKCYAIRLQTAGRVDGEWVYDAGTEIVGVEFFGYAMEE
jgi:hypothetical protein